LQLEDMLYWKRGSINTSNSMSPSREPRYTLSKQYYVSKYLVQHYFHILL